MNSAEVVKLIQANGWQLVRIAGRHHQARGETGARHQHPKNDLPAGTLNSILKQAGLK